MQLKISSSVIKKIMNSPNGRVVADELCGFSKRSNNRYTRGMLHGYLLCLTMQGVIEKREALEILEQLQER